MSAQIIAFPRKKKRGAKVRRGPCAQIIISPYAQRDHWTPSDHHLFAHFQRCDGNSEEEAVERVEEAIADSNELGHLPEQDKLFRMALRNMMRAIAITH